MNFWKAFLSLAICCGLALGVQAQEYKHHKTLTGHVGKVQNLRFSPDGQMLATGGHDGNTILWDVPSGKALRTLKGHLDVVYEVTFNKKGSQLVSASGDGTAKVWDTKTGKCLGTYFNKPFRQPNGQFFTSVSFAVFSPDGRYIYFSGDNGYIMKADTRSENGLAKPAEVIYDCNHRDGRWYSTVTGGAITNDDKYLVFTVGQYVKFIDLQTDIDAKTFKYDIENLNDVVAGPLPGMVAVWSYDGRVSFWNIATGRQTASYQVAEPQEYSAASFSKDGRYMVTSAAGTALKLWDLSNGRNIATLRGHSQVVRLSRFSPTENLIASARYDGTVRLWKEVPPPIVEPVAKKDPEPVASTQKTDPKPNDPPKENKPAPTGPIFNNERVEVGKVIQLQNILFEQSSYVLRRESFEELDKLVKFMKENPSVEIELGGHTDNVGDPGKNHTLAERRVTAAKNYLMQHGINGERINTAAYGGSKPIASNDTEQGRQRNRRVEMKILKL